MKNKLALSALSAGLLSTASFAATATPVTISDADQQLLLDTITAQAGTFVGILIGIAVVSISLHFVLKMVRAHKSV